MFHTPHTVARFVLDTCSVIDWNDDPARFDALRKLHQEFRCALVNTDVVDTELDPSKNLKAGDSYLASVEFLEIFGPLVAGNSRADHAVFGTASDKQRFEEVKAIVGIRTSSMRNQQHDIRDAMHISTAIRYGYDGFITSDNRLLSRAEPLLRQFQFRIFEVEMAVSYVQNLIDRQIQREALGSNAPRTGMWSPEHRK